MAKAKKQVELSMLEMQIQVKNKHMRDLENKKNSENPRLESGEEESGDYSGGIALPELEDELAGVLDRHECRSWAEEVEEQECGFQIIKDVGKQKQGSDNLQGMVKEDSMMKLRKALFSGNRMQQGGMKLECVPMEDDVLVLKDHELESEIDYWKFALIFYVLSTKVSLSAMESFIKHNWGAIAMPQISMHDHGYSLFRFEKE
ncbi:hypothetical protein Ancab_005408 [Ancistrocladus abbreviatus]